jgi:hypothetical protein
MLFSFNLIPSCEEEQVVNHSHKHKLETLKHANTSTLCAQGESHSQSQQNLSQNALMRSHTYTHENESLAIHTTGEWCREPI